MYVCREILRSLGEAGLVATETEALLIDNEIDYEEFSPEVEACLPPQPWTIPPVCMYDTCVWICVHVLH